MTPNSTQHVTLGDPVPGFTARTVTGASVSLHVDAGRWILLSFLGSLADQRAAEELAALLREARLFSEPHLVAYVILTEPPQPEALTMLAAVSGPALAFIADYDGAITRSFGAELMRRSVVLDPMQRAIADIPWDHAAGHAALLCQVLRELPPVADSAGVPLWAPALIVPRVLDFALCDFLVKLYDAMGGEESGFMLDQDGKTASVIDHRLKRRRDLIIVDPELRETIRGQILRRLIPAIDQFFGFAATRMDRYIVSCYDSAVGGHFFRHRDNVNAGAQHRRFAVSINLNKDYEGCDLVFPEFGPRPYRPPVGGAVAFSAGMLHEVTPITRGRRHVFVPFLYGEADAARRESNNARLRDGESLYVGGADRLFPEAAE
ncbi:MAG TPA: 2OG-Fe(II) oxygenase [Stellaceae bacterium]|jgi:predicted 2-oxoglutarate/Fe(II)-dependent dioxygenase YbiX|nr:2OG-Fe(II) oxygenase [Stellaceae bacterium]